MTNDPKEWWHDKCNDTFYLVEDEHSCCIKPEQTKAYSAWLVYESRFRFKEEVLRALEGMKKGFVSAECNSDEEYGYDEAIKEAIERIKGL